MSYSEFSGKYFVKSQANVSVAVDNNEIVLQTTEGAYYSLNATAQDIWRMLDRPCQFEALVRHILDSYEVESSACVADLNDIVGALLQHDLIVEHLPE